MLIKCLVLLICLSNVLCQFRRDGKCSGTSFRCSNGQCIPSTSVCDGAVDCADRSDETQAVCTELSLPNGCLLPEKPTDGDYEVSDCEEGNFSDKCRKVPGTVVLPNVVLTYSCSPGYLLPENMENSFCKKGIWSPKLPQCQKLCKGLQSDSVDLTCWYRGSEVDCVNPVRPETELRAKCKNTYHLSDPSPQASFTVTECRHDGTWAHDLYKCYPDCGIRNIITQIITPKIKRGASTKQSEYPWHAALYRNNNGIFDCVCVGTIIHPKAIITAAHCVYNETVMKPADKELLRVGVGKYRSSWDIHESTDDQRFKVVEIIIQSAYYGKNNRYEQDIAILDLDKLIILSSGVMPICLDRGDGLSLYKDPMAVGTVVGWGITDKNLSSDVLLVARLPFFDFHNCRSKVGFDKFSEYITYDKFCAGLENGTSVQQGNSGGALTFPRKTGNLEQHFIYGIVSLKPIESDKIAAFTNVSIHMEWIDKVLSAIKFKKPNL